MKKKEFTDTLTKLSDSKETFNSNNAWGFGGAYGTIYNFKDNTVEVKVATACYRHTSSTPFIKLTTSDDTEFLDLTDTQKNRQMLLNNLNRILQDSSIV